MSSTLVAFSHQLAFWGKGGGGKGMGWLSLPQSFRVPHSCCVCDKLLRRLHQIISAGYLWVWNHACWQLGSVWFLTWLLQFSFCQNLSRSSHHKTELLGTASFSNKLLSSSKKSQVKCKARLIHSNTHHTGICKYHQMYRCPSWSMGRRWGGWFLVRSVVTEAGRRSLW